MSAGLGTTPLTPLPPAAVGPILLAEGYASVAADWHMEWMLPERLEEGLEARAEIAAQLAGRPGSGRGDQDDPFRRRRRWRQTRPGGQLAAADFVASQQRGSVAGTAPLARRPNPG